MNIFRKHPAKLLLCCIALFLVALFAREAHRADAGSTVTLDPLNGMWHERIVPKHRAIATYRNPDWSMRTFTASDRTVADPLPGADPEYISKGSDFGLTFDSDTFVFATASTGGVVLATETISPDFYGVTTFENVPREVLVNTYLIRENDSANTTSAWIELSNADGRIGRMKFDFTPSYHFEVKYDLSWKYAPALDKNTAHDVLGHDWNGDGYTDYLISYIKADGNNGRNGVAAMLALVDGKGLYDYVTEKTTTKPAVYHIPGTGGFSFSTGKNIVGGKTDVKPSNSYRIAIGDLDGDGVPEVAAYFTKIHGANAGEHRNNQIEVYKIAYAEPNYTFTPIYSSGSKDDGESFMQNDSVGVAMGDIDGDGADEMVTLYGRTRNLHEWTEIYMNIYKYKEGALQRVFTGDRDHIIEELYKVTGEKSSVSPFNMQITDLDGDGRGELVWTAAKNINDDMILNLWVHKWSGAIENTGSQYRYKLSLPEYGGMYLNNNYFKHSLAAGTFNYPDGTAATYKGVPHQIAVGHLGGSSAAAADTTNIDVGIYKWDAANGLQMLGHKAYEDQAMKGNMGVTVAAVDFFRESLILGEPASITVEDNVELFFLAQAPPKHWDRVNIAGSNLASDDADGKTTMDAFAVIENSALAGGDGYFTSISASTGQSSTTETTETSEGTWGAEFSYQLEQREKLKDKLFARNRHDKDDDPLLDVGLSYAGETAHNTTDSYSISFEYAYSVEADRDDQIYYRANDYTISRYPILFPLDMRTLTVSDDQGVEYQAVSYLQFVVPTSVANTFTPTPGRNICWYEPLHDSYNLFTYPKQLEDVSGYPQGQKKKEEMNPEDPWIFRNGTVLIKGENNIIGNLDSSTAELKITQQESHETLDSLHHTLGGHVYFHPQFGKDDRQNLNIDLTGEGTWGTDTTTTTDASKGLGALINWSGVKTYNAYSNWWQTSDMEFNAGIAYFTQDDGAFVIGFAIPSLGTQQSGSGALWGPKSPYRIHPDPGFNLPYRWNNELKAVDSAGKELPKYRLAENTNVYTRYTLRGLTFKNKNNGEPAPVGTQDASKQPLKLLEKNTPYSLELRVINYSLVATKGQTHVRFYRQPVNLENGFPDEPAESMAGLEEIGSYAVGQIAGRGSSKTAPDNWGYAQIDWTTPNETGLFYIHAVAEYDGVQLNEKNDHGYMLVATYDPAMFSNAADAFAAYAAPGFAQIAQQAKPDLRITDVKAYAINREGEITKELVRLQDARFQRARFDVTVEFERGEIATAKGVVPMNDLPLVRCAILTGRAGVNRSIVAAQEFPLVGDGKSYTFSMIYDAYKNDLQNGVAIRAFSPFLPTSAQRDPESQTVILWGSAHGDGSGGGCSGIGSGAAALLALAGLPLLRRKKR